MDLIVVALIFCFCALVYYIKLVQKFDDETTFKKYFNIEFDLAESLKRPIMNDAHIVIKHDTADVGPFSAFKFVQKNSNFYIEYDTTPKTLSGSVDFRYSPSRVFFNERDLSELYGQADGALRDYLLTKETYRGINNKETEYRKHLGTYSIIISENIKTKGVCFTKIPSLGSLFSNEEELKLYKNYLEACVKHLFDMRKNSQDQYEQLRQLTANKHHLPEESRL